MRQTIFSSMIFMVIMAGCIGTDFSDDRTPSIVIEPSVDSILLIEGETVEIDARFLNREGVEEAVELIWNTGDPTIASVPLSGKTITGVSAGRTNLTIGPEGGLEDNPDDFISKDLEVIVIQDPALATSVSITTSNNGVVNGEQKQLTAIAINAINDTIQNPVFTWESDDESVLSVDGQGLLTANSIGSANITASKDDIVSNNFLVNVVGSNSEISSIQLTIDSGVQRLGANGSIQAIAFNTLNQEIGSSSDFMFESSDNGILTIDDEGNFNTISEGSVTVTASLTNDSGNTISSPELSVEVVDPNRIIELRISSQTNTVVIEETLQLSAIATNAFGESVSADVLWSSSNSETATIDQNGLLTAVTSGIITVTASTNDGLSASLAIMVISSNVRSGSFVGVNGYQARGSAMLVQRDEEIFLEIGSDFVVSNGPGIFWYLSNTSNGRTTLTQGLLVSEDRVAEGAQTFNITELDPNVTLESYDFIVVVCVPFGGITFGFAEFE